MAAGLLRLVHGFIRRYLSVFERLLVAVGLTLALYSLLASRPVYPPYWDSVLCALTFLLTLAAPAAAYFFAVAVATYPLYSLSIYLAVLFVCVALLGQRAFILNLGATVLVLVTPWLAPFGLSWLAPVLGGLWWGRTGGLWIGMAAAAWGLLAGAMTGYQPDWLTMIGAAPSLDQMAEIFSGANSLQTLLLMLAPLAPDPTRLLYLLLQTGIWGLVGLFVGAMADRGLSRRQTPWSNLATSFFGASLLLGLHLGLALWVQVHTLESLRPLWDWLILSTFFAALIPGALDAVVDFVEHPVSPPPRRRLAPSSSAERWLNRLGRSTPAEALPAMPTNTGESPPSASPGDENSQNNPKTPKSNDSDDLIMLELD